MSRFVYSLVRCVPEPRTGEFINIAAIAGDPLTGDWTVRQVGNESRVRKIAGPQDLAVVHRFISRLGAEIDEQWQLMDQGDGKPLSEIWLKELHANHQNIVQLSSPAPIVADDVDDAMDLIFSRLIIDPVRQPRGGITKSTLLANLRAVYREFDVDPDLVRPSVEVFVGDRVHTGFDFAIANGEALQLTQAWSFQRAGIDEIGLQVKAWGYALGRLRAGDKARMVDSQSAVSTVARDVDVEVVIAEPRTSDQLAVFEEATQVFQELGVSVHPGEASAIGQRAASLIAEHLPGRHPDIFPSEPDVDRERTFRDKDSF